MPLGPFDNLYGMGVSPLVAENGVFLVCDQQTGSFLIAVDKDTGKQLWKVDRPEATSGHSTPILYEPKPRLSDRRNIILISLDTLRADHLSVYGYPRATSPYLAAKFGGEGVVFESMVASATTTGPAARSCRWVSMIQTTRDCICGVSSSRSRPMGASVGGFRSTKW